MQKKNTLKLNRKKNNNSKNKKTKQRGNNVWKSQSTFWFLNIILPPSLPCLFVFVFVLFFPGINLNGRKILEKINFLRK